MKFRKLITIILLVLSANMIAQEKNELHFTGGLKVGFHAANYNSTVFEIDGYKYNDRRIGSNRIGYSVTPFMRLSKNRSYLQVETTFSISSHNFDFTETMPGDIETTPKNAEYKLRTYCLQIPILYGYNFVQNNLYGMSVFTGPKTKIIFTSLTDKEFNNFAIEDLYEDIKPVTYYWQIGLGIKIANVFFDFTYDIGLNNTTRGIISESMGKRYKAKRSDSILGFSVGIIF